MENNRDDFSNVLKDVLAKRAGYLCSNYRLLTVCANEILKGLILILILQKPFQGYE